MKADPYNNKFSEKVRARGRSYFRQNRVELTECEPANVSAIVTGSDIYATYINFKDDGEIARMSCTCPFYVDWGSNCKHLWATLLKYEETLHESGGTGPGESAPGPGRVRQSWKEAAKRIKPPDRPARLREPAQHEGPRALPYYLLNVDTTVSSGQPTLVIAKRTRRKNGEWGSFTSTGTNEIDLFHDTGDPRDFQIAAVLGAIRGDFYYGLYNRGRSHYREYSSSRITTLIPIMLETGRFGYVEHEKADPVIVTEDTGGSWELRYALDGDEKNGFIVRRWLQRGDETIDFIDTAVLLDGDPVWCFTGDRCIKIKKEFDFSWIAAFPRHEETLIEKEELPDFFNFVARGGADAPDFQLPDGIEFVEDDSVSPEPQLVVEFVGDYVRGAISFNYQSHNIAWNDPRRRILNVEDWRFIIRRHDEEYRALETFGKHGFDRVDSGGESWIPAGDAFAALEALLEKGYLILGVEGKPIRPHSGFNMNVSSGIDWFGLEGAVDYDGASVSIHELIAQYAEGRRLVRLEGGELGLMPREWLERNIALLDMGTPGDEGVRYSRAQVGLLDTILEQSPAIHFDEKFRKARDRFRCFEQIEHVRLTSAFKGRLRDYQREGLGWLNFLDEFEFGGCLADDMGLGKTVQVLALLSLPRIRKQGVSIVVAPASLVYNWIAEAKRFTPGLKTLAYTGPARMKQLDSLHKKNLVVTTYGIALRDIEELKHIQFNYAILDESQAIKNSKTKTAAAVRTIDARNRLALTGTPLENRLEELWSQFEFLNPGLLGTEKKFQNRFVDPAGNGDASDTGRDILKKTIKPFLLRRMKEEVELDLPPKNEQTVTCEMTASQRKTYERLAAHFRRQIIDSMNSRGLNRSKMKVIEGLLRLRQACCHPELLGPQLNTARARKSGKFELFCEMAASAVSERHKILVFSQFTSMLAIIRKWFDREKIPYTYLDGRTRDRASRIEQFQQDDSCRAFLISLKAGGLGLNLTAADYVFIYDPWWNPAVEAQAVDRAHRIGQDKTVFTYRLITADSIEEKIRQLQGAKKKLVESVLSGQENLFRDLTREDIENLFS